MREQATAASVPALRFPSLPTAAEARAAALERTAAEIVATYGSATARALAAWLDEVAASGAGDAEP